MRWSPAIRQLAWLIARPIAHRGLHDRARGIIENSPAAFAAAIAAGYAIECDVQLTADGETVVFHDHTLERLTEGRGAVRTHTLQRLQGLTLRGSHERMPSLSEVLDQVAGRVPLLIELKSCWDGNGALVHRALAVLEPYGGPYALMSFDPDMVEAIRMLSPRTVRGIVADPVRDSFYTALPFARRLALREMTHLPCTRPHFVSFQFDGLPCDPVRHIRSSGRPVITWTVRDAAQAAQARRYSDQITFEGFRPE